MGCPSNKTVYITRTKAKAACKVVKSAGKGNLVYCPRNIKLRPFKCTLCNMWHVTSTPNKDRFVEVQEAQ